MSTNKMTNVRNRNEKTKNTSMATGAIGALIIVAATCGTATAQPGAGSFRIQHVSISSAYMDVQLPPITLSGYLPQDALSDDLITTGETAVTWSKNGRRSTFRLDLSGSYTGRVKYSSMNAFGGSADLGWSTAIGRKWRAALGLGQAVSSSDQLPFAPSQFQELASTPSTFGDLSSALALARSVRPASNPDIAQAFLFVPISQSLAAGDVYGDRIGSSSGNVSLTFAPSPRLSVFGGFGFSILKQFSSSDPATSVLFEDYTAQVASGGLSYALTRRSSLSVSAARSRSTAVFTGQGTSGSITYGWAGRKWFTSDGVGLGQADQATIVRVTDEQGVSAPRKPKPQLTYNVNAGFKTRTHTLLVGHIRALADTRGYIAVEPLTGFSHDVTSLLASWYWVPGLAKWVVQANLTEHRNFGNFSYIYTWHANASVGRQLHPKVRLIGEFLFDRHGSRGFEGFHLTRQGFRMTLMWAPQARRE